MPLPKMHLLQLEKHWQTHELIFCNGERRDLKDLFQGVALGTFAHGGIIFHLYPSGKKIIIRPFRDEINKQWLAQKLWLSPNRREWRTLGELRAFDNIRMQKMEEKDF